jgi:sugar phosphate isomerase/epimerase
MFSRREWMRRAGVAAVGAVAARRTAALGQTTPSAAPSSRPTYCLFSKPLPELDWPSLGQSGKDAGFEGVDLTVRPNGHVLPERAVDDLPRALDAIRSKGVSVPMITTDLTSASAAVAKPLLATAARHGVRYFKTGYWRFTASPDVRAQVAAAGEAVAGLAALARDCGIELGFHNHTAYIGAALWDIAPALDRLDAKWAGYYFDPRHAVAEGGGGAWKSAAQLAAARLKMVALKDFYWEKAATGWRIRDCALGTGMVDWPWFAGILRQHRFAGPISMHFEYEIAGSTPAERTRHTLDAATRDLAAAKQLLT